MARICNLCGKGTKIGHNVSYSKRRTRRVFLPNLRRVKLGSGKRIKVCTDCLGKLKKEGKIFKRVARARVPKVAQVEQVEKVETPKKRGRPKKTRSGEIQA